MRTFAPYAVAIGALLVSPSIDGWAFLAAMVVFAVAVCVALVDAAVADRVGPRGDQR